MKGKLVQHCRSSFGYDTDPVVQSGPFFIFGAGTQSFTRIHHANDSIDKTEAKEKVVKGTPWKY